MPLFCLHREGITCPACSKESLFSAANFRKPELPAGLKVVDVELEEATDAALAAVGARLIHSADEVSVANGNFDIVKWPVQGWRALDPDTGHEAGTTEGPFAVHWEGDYFFGHNLSIASSNNYYLDGLATVPEVAQHLPHIATPPAHASALPHDGETAQEKETHYIYLWMTDKHPDGGQLFWSDQGVPFTVCLGPAGVGDDVRPEHMRAFAVPAGKGVYFGPNTWHNGVYTHSSLGPCRFLTRQGRVHARVSCSWAVEFQTLLRVPLHTGPLHTGTCTGVDNGKRKGGPAWVGSGTKL